MSVAGSRTLALKRSGKPEAHPVRWAGGRVGAGDHAPALREEWGGSGPSFVGQGDRAGRVAFALLDRSWSISILWRYVRWRARSRIGFVAVWPQRQAGTWGVAATVLDQQFRRAAMPIIV